MAKHLGEAVDQVRRRERKTLKAAGDDRLSGTRYDWLRSRAAMESNDRRAFDALRRSGLKTARARALKETAMAVQIDLHEHAELWMEFDDVLVSQSRRNEEDIPLEQIKAELIQSGRLRG